MGGATSPRILIVDDHPLFRDALETAIGRASDNDADISSTGTLEEALDAARENFPDLILLDLNLTDASGFDGVMRFKALNENAVVAIVSATEAPEAFAQARALGAKAYLPKSLPIETLSQAVDAVLAGEDWFPAGEAEANGALAGPAQNVSTLTPAQRRVLDGLSEGLLNKQIAYEMGISEATVKAHMTAIFRKLGVNNRTQALLALKQATSLGDYSAA